MSIGKEVIQKCCKSILLNKKRTYQMKQKININFLYFLLMKFHFFNKKIESNTQAYFIKILQ